MAKFNCMLLLAVSLFWLGESRAAIIPQDRGAWPRDWPKELEKFRQTARTIGVATGIQENIYEIPLSDRETFENLWPVILKLRTPGSPLTLYKAGSAAPRGWEQFLTNKKAAIRIYGPAQSLQADAPKPEPPAGRKGALPEYALKRTVDDTVQWIAADPHDRSKTPRGFYYRARIDVELVVDGTIVDLNRIKLPDDARIVDRRFGDE